MTNVLVGCPVLRREWIIQEWMRRADVSCERAGLEPSYLLVGDSRDPTMGKAALEAAILGRELDIVNIVDTGLEHPHEHAWANPENLHKMVYLRNVLLTRVRERSPHMFLSLDSDILLHEDHVTEMLETLIGGFDAVGGKVYLGGRHLPSWANYSQNTGLSRHDVDYVLRVDIIMALKLMMPAAYWVDYEYEKNGEDIGWSLACRDRGMRLGFDGRTASKHVMKQVDDNGRHWTETIDWKVGY